MTHSETPRKSNVQPLLIVASAVLAVLVIVLAWQNLQLKKTISRLNARGPVVDVMKPGDPVGDVVLIDDSGTEQPLAFGDAPQGTLLLVFSTECPACAETLPIWSGLHDVVGDASPQILALRLNDGGDGAILPYPVYRIDVERTTELAKVPYIPAALLVDAQGTIRRSWFGVPDDAQQAELMQVMRGS